MGHINMHFDREPPKIGKCGAAQPHAAHAYSTGYDGVSPVYTKCNGVSAKPHVQYGCTCALCVVDRPLSREQVLDLAADQIIKTWKSNGEEFTLYADGPSEKEPDYEALSQLDPRMLTTANLIGLIDFLWECQ